MARAKGLMRYAVYGAGAFLLVWLFVARRGARMGAEMPDGGGNIFVWIILAIAVVCGALCWWIVRREQGR